MTLSAHVGEEIPELRVPTLDHGIFSNETFSGRPLVVVMFASWCAPCRFELPLIISDYEMYKSTVAFVGVDVNDSKERARSYIAEMKIPFPVVRVQSKRPDDPSLESNDSISFKLPTNIVADSRGVVRFVDSGFDGRSHVRELLARLARM